MGINLDIKNDMAKADECHLIDKLVKAYDKCPDNYLASFFTKDLQGWIDKQIAIDGSTDVMSYVSDYWNVKAEVDTLKNRIALIAEQNAEKHNETYRQHQTTCEMYVERANELNAEIKKQEETINRLDNIAAELRAQIKLLESTLKNKDLDIMTLKAKMYDLEHPEK